MKILVTGSSGFIGFHLCTYFLKERFKVYGIDNHNKYYSNKIKQKRLNILKKNKNFNFKKLDLVKKKDLNKFFFYNKPDIVFHLAGQPGVLYSFKNPNSYFRNNYQATKNLIECINKFNCKKLIFASSSSVYGEQVKFPLKESFKLKPKNFYAKTKVMCENLIKKKITKEFIIFRFFTVYGSYGRPDMFIHKFLNNIILNKETKIYNFGKNFRDFTYVQDIAKILKKSINIQTTKKIINICRSKPIQTIKLIKLIKKFLKKKELNVLFVKPQKGEMLKTYGDNSVLRREIGKIKFTDIEKGLKNTIKNFNKVGM